MQQTEHPDAALIDSFGGPSALALALGLSGVGQVQRVWNWRKRGIPSAVKCDHPDVFFAVKKLVNDAADSQPGRA